MATYKIPLILARSASEEVKMVYNIGKTSLDMIPRYYNKTYEMLGRYLRGERLQYLRLKFFRSCYRNYEMVQPEYATILKSFTPNRHYWIASRMCTSELATFLATQHPKVYFDLQGLDPFYLEHDLSIEDAIVTATTSKLLTGTKG